MKLFLSIMGVFVVIGVIVVVFDTLIGTAPIQPIRWILVGVALTGMGIIAWIANRNFWQQYRSGMTSRTLGEKPKGPAMPGRRRKGQTPADPSSPLHTGRTQPNKAQDDQ